jgi:hypothetical protein
MNGGAVLLSFFLISISLFSKFGKLGTDGKFSIFGRAQVRAVGPPFDAARISGDGDREVTQTTSSEER